MNNEQLVKQINRNLVLYCHQFNGYALSELSQTAWNLHILIEKSFKHFFYKKN